MAFYKIRPKSGTAEQWERANTVLGEREIGYEYPPGGIGTGVVKMKMGDGKTAWNDLPYAQVVPMTADDIVSVDSTANNKVPSAGYTKKKFDDLNNKFGSFTFWDNVSTGDNGATSLTMSRPMRNDHTYMVIVRAYNGSLNTHAPYMYLLSMRSQNWSHTVIGEEYGVVSKNISDGKLTLTFKDLQWTRMAVFEIM